MEFSNDTEYLRLIERDIKIRRETRDEQSL